MSIQDEKFVDIGNGKCVPKDVKMLGEIVPRCDGCSYLKSIIKDDEYKPYNQLLGLKRDITFCSLFSVNITDGWKCKKCSEFSSSQSFTLLDELTGQAEYITSTMKQLLPLLLNLKNVSSKFYNNMRWESLTDEDTEKTEVGSDKITDSQYTALFKYMRPLEDTNVYDGMYDFIEQVAGYIEKTNTVKEKEGE